MAGRAQVPPLISGIQARRALRQPENAALKSAIEAWIAADATKQRAEDWEYSTEYPRDSAMIEAARVDLQLSHAQIDALYRLAATL